jgi:hypothetical protein
MLCQLSAFPLSRGIEYLSGGLKLMEGLMKYPLKTLNVRAQPEALAYSKDMAFSPDPVLSYFLSALSLFVPIAEHDFIHRVRQYL